MAKRRPEKIQGRCPRCSGIGCLWVNWDWRFEHWVCYCSQCNRNGIDLEKSSAVRRFFRQDRKER